MDDKVVTEQHIMGLYAVARQEVKALAETREGLKTLANDVGEQVGTNARKAVSEALERVPEAVLSIREASLQARQVLWRISVWQLVAILLLGVVLGSGVTYWLLSSHQFDELKARQDGLYRAIIESRKTLPKAAKHG